MTDALHQEKTSLEQDLAAALDTGGLRMFVQPQGRPDGSVSGVELLARWQHATEGEVSPEVFIPLAEQGGLIARLTDWSLDVACGLARILHRRGRPLAISVNISPVCLMAPDFSQRVRRVLTRTCTSGADLVFEITEGVWLRDASATQLRIDELQAMGIRFSVDDFGSGYSNLAYLKDLPLYEIKLDRSLVSGLPTDPGSCAIVEMVLALARRLTLRTTAEGVETAAQAQFLLQNGCDALQGHLLARPMPIEAWLATWIPRRWPAGAVARQ